MKQCHECDSDVADNDLFCPYCGISIQGVAVETAAADDAFSSTIVIPSPVKPSELIVPESVLMASEPAIESSVEKEESLSALEEAKETDSDAEFSNSLTEESIDIVTSPDFDPIEEISDNETLSEIDSDAMGIVDNSPAVADIKGEVAEEPRIAERLTGAIGSISGRFSPPSLSEIEEPEEDPVVETAAEIDEQPVVIETEPDIVTESEPVVDDISDDVDEDVSKAEDSENINEEPGEADQHLVEEDVSVSDIPVPSLLSDHEIDSAIEKIGDPELDASAFDISKPAEADVIEEATDEGYVAGNAIVPAVMEVVSEPIKEPETFEKPNVAESSTDDIEHVAEAEPEPELAISEEQPEPTPLFMTNLDEITQSEEPTPEKVEVPQPPVPVTDEPLQHAVADTGDGLKGQEVIGGTKPNIGSSDTDGRKSGLKPLSEGTVLNNRYDIVRKIGGGGMGAVYLANDRNLGGVQRAVKEMVQSHIEEEQQEKAVDDFKRESTILSTLDHPSIPTIYDYFFDAQESRFYLVMKYISGGDLAGKLRSTPEGRIDEMTVTEWSLQIIDVLNYLHNLPTKIVYRDLKPSNVMIDGNTGRIMLIDFGIARSINQNQEKGVTAVGTMGYAPPELFSGNVEPRSDIYSLGSTMFHLLTGADPQNNPLLIFDFQKNPRPRQINPQLSDQIERILMRAVEYNADARFASAAEMKYALADHLDNLRTGQITYGVTEVPQSVSLSHQIVFCGFCGQRIVATDLFCAFCGSKQPLAQHGVHREVYSPAVGTARLVIEGTSDLMAPAYGIEKNENLVGRRDPMSNIFPEVDLSKYDPQTKISRRHAKIWRDGTNFLVEDLGSSNGTILLTKLSDTLRLMPHQPHPLASGDRIRIGDTTLQFIVG